MHNVGYEGVLEDEASDPLSVTDAKLESSVPDDEPWAFLDDERATNYDEVRTLSPVPADDNVRDGSLLVHDRSQKGVLELDVVDFEIASRLKLLERDRAIRRWARTVSLMALSKPENQLRRKPHTKSPLGRLMNEGLAGPASPRKSRSQCIQLVTLVLSPVPSSSTCLDQSCLPLRMYRECFLLCLMKGRDLRDKSSRHL